MTSPAPSLSAATVSCPICGLHHAPSANCPILTSLAPRVATNVLAPGTLLAGRFVVDAVSHRSKMSVVYRAREIGGLCVAIKQISTMGVSPDEKAESLLWLAREAGLLSSLSDPHLPDLISAFSEGDHHYVVMPYLEGRTIKERVAAEGPLPEADAVVLALALAETLCYLHGQDPPVIHRDLKPDNILMQSTGHLVLLDLGVARPLPPGEIGTAIGTPGYAAPEQYQGMAGERSDLYAFGATLYCMLTGYDAEHEEPFRQPNVRTLQPGVSGPLAALVTALLQIAPQQRPRHARDVVTYLENLGEIEIDTMARVLCLANGRRYLAVVVGLVTTWLAGGALMYASSLIAPTLTTQCAFFYGPTVLALVYALWCKAREGFYAKDTGSAVQQARRRIEQRVRKWQRLTVVLVLAFACLSVIPGSQVFCLLALVLCYPAGMWLSARALRSQLERRHGIRLGATSDQMPTLLLPSGE